jgi:hypothetical protein
MIRMLRWHSLISIRSGGVVTAHADEQVHCPKATTIVGCNKSPAPANNIAANPSRWSWLLGQTFHSLDAKLPLQTNLQQQRADHSTSSDSVHMLSASYSLCFTPAGDSAPRLPDDAMHCVRAPGLISTSRCYCLHRRCSEKANHKA